MAVSVIASVTDTAKFYYGDMTAVSGRGFKVISFALGEEGHDPNDPTTPLDPDPTLIELPGLIFGPKNIPEADVDFTDPQNPTWACKLEESEAVGFYSSIALYAQIVSSPIVHYILPFDNLSGGTFTVGDNIEKTGGGSWTAEVVQVFSNYLVIKELAGGTPVNNDPFDNGSGVAADINLPTGTIQETPDPVIGTTFMHSIGNMARDEKFDYQDLTFHVNIIFGN